MNRYSDLGHHPCRGTLIEEDSPMTVHPIAQLKFTDRTAYDDR
jgi:hypothetical protein